VYTKDHPDKQKLQEYLDFYCNPDSPAMRGKSFDQRFAEMNADPGVVMPTLDRAFTHSGKNYCFKCMYR